MASPPVLSSHFSFIPHKSYHRRSLSVPSSSISNHTLLKPNENSLFFSKNPSRAVLISRKFVACTSIRDTDATDSSLVGEDSAEFYFGQQKMSSWVYFTAILGVVLFVLNVAWIDNSTGYGKAFIEAVSGLSDSHEVISFSFHLWKVYESSFIVLIYKSLYLIDI